MGEMVIAVYRPKPGSEQRLLELVRGHVPFLRGLGLATDRPAVAMRADNGDILELFEWCEGGVEAAHAHPQVEKLWERFAEVCDYVPLSEVPGIDRPFPAFQPLEL